MKTMSVREFGGPEVLVAADAAEPIAGPGEVVVDHEFIGVNFVDTQHRAGTPYPVDLPLVVGIEAAGTVSSVGDGADYVVGDRVAYGGIMPGVYAERAVVPADWTVPIPADIETSVAAGVLVQGWTAHMLTEVADIESGRDATAVVFAAGGGTGSLLAQFLVAAGVRVIGVTSGVARCAMLDSIGVESLDRMQCDVVADVAVRVAGGVDVVFDGVGGAAFDQARRMLRPKGHLVAYGQSAGAAPAIDPAILSGISPLGGPGSLRLTWPTLNDHNATVADRHRRTSEVFDRIRSGMLQPRIDVELGLSDAAEAHRRLEAGGIVGKLVLDARR